MQEKKEFAIKKKFKSPIVLLKNKYIRGFTTSDEFFEYIDYVLEAFLYKQNFLNKWVSRTVKSVDEKTGKTELIPVLSKEQRLDLIRALSFMAYAHNEGLIYVNWSALYEMQLDVLHPAAMEVYRALVKKHPAIAKEWDDELKRQITPEGQSIEK